MIQLSSTEVDSNLSASSASLRSSHLTEYSVAQYCEYLAQVSVVLVLVFVIYMAS